MRKLAGVITDAMICVSRLARDRKSGDLFNLPMIDAGTLLYVV